MLLVVAVSTSSLAAAAAGIDEVLVVLQGGWSQLLEPRPHTVIE